MLRECFRVLVQGGKIAGYLIHTSEGLTPAERARAIELGPAEVDAEGSPAELSRRAGFVVTLLRDLTTEFETTCRALLQARREYSEALREEEGEETFEYELGRKVQMLEGIQAGLLRRSLLVAEKE